MKKILIFLVLNGFFQTAEACRCSPNFFESCINADFIGEVKITKTYKKESSDAAHRYYKVDVETITVYKGEKQQTLYFYGSNDSTSWGSCDLTVAPNTTWLVYSTKDVRGNFSIGACTPSHKVRSTFNLYDSLAYGKKMLDNIVANEKRERDFVLQMNKYTKDFGKQIPHSFGLSSYIPNVYTYLNTFKGQTFDKQFGLYKIILNKDCTLKKVVVVKSFGRKFDKKLINFIKKQEFTTLKRIKKEVPPDTYLPLLVYFYETDKFLGNIFLL